MNRPPNRPPTYPPTSPPTSGTRWEERRVTVGTNPPVTVLLRRDATATSRTTYSVLPKAPQVLRLANGDPTFTLTLTLQRQPRVDDTEIASLVERGQLGVTISTAIPPDLLAALQDGEDADFKPLFAREIVATLESEGFVAPVVIASVSGSGSDPRLALSANLDRGQALDTYTSLDSAISRLRLRVHFKYRTSAQPRRVRIVASAVAIYDAIADHVDRAGTVWRHDLDAIYGELLRTGVIEADELSNFVDATRVSQPDQKALIAACLRVTSFLLNRTTTDIPSDDPNNRYELRDRPHPSMQIDLTLSLEGRDEEDVELTAPLNELLGGILIGRDRSKFVHMIGPSGGGGGDYQPVPRRINRSRGVPGTRGPGDEKPIQMAVAGGKISSLALAMTPDTSTPLAAHALITSDAVLAHGGASIWAGDVVVGNIETSGGNLPLSLPIVEDGSAPLWPDRKDANSFWYAPALTVVQPQPDADPATSPFLFSFTRTGVTGGVKPTAALTGTVRFTLHQGMSDATAKALQERSNPSAKPVPVGGLSVFLDLPFRDENADQTLSQRLTATVEQTGDTIVATVELVNDWVRLCYGALAYPNFQPNPATLSAAYAFRAYVPINYGEVQFTYGGKIALTQLASSRLDLPQKINRPVFTADDATMHLPRAELKYAREAPDIAPRAALDRRPTQFRIRPVGDEVTFDSDATYQTIPIRPDIEITPIFEPVIAERRYGQQTIVHQESPAAFFPCSTLGGFYVQEVDGIQSVIGCQDALRLGEIAYRAYEELADLRTEHYRVFHSLQQPGRFLVLPAAYRITRYGPTEPAERAYRPTAMVYATVDPNPSLNRYFFRSTLQGDIPEHERVSLISTLKPFTPFGRTPQIDYPTEPAVQVTTSYTWALPQGVGEPETQQMWDGFQVSVSTDLTNAALLITILESDGLEGQVTFRLPDGTSLIARLVLDGAICGPWIGGPIETTLSGKTATLRNRIEQTINLFELVATDVAGTEQRVRLDQSLAPNASTTATLTEAATAAFPAYETVVTPLSLTERDVFVEDVVTNVLFVNLVNYANHNVQRLRGQVRLKEAQHQEEVNLAENGTASITMTLPLTTYLEQQIVEYQITKTFSNGDPETTTPWREWNLATQGITISLTWELIA